MLDEQIHPNRCIRLNIAFFCAIGVAFLSAAQEPEVSTQNQITDDAILTGQLEPLDTLYAALEDRSRWEEWNAAVRQIAAHGRSDKSTSVLLAFVKRGLPDGLGRIRVLQECTLKINILMYLSLTGGDEARNAMKDAFFGNHGYLTANWLSRANEEVAAARRDYSWTNSLRGRAALGLLVSGNRRDERMVRRYFQALHRATPISDEATGDLFSKLLDSLVDADYVDAQGKNGVLYLSGLCPMGEDSIREKYLADGRR